eukprot:1024160-Alexandrium_andersonii.AAC.1
MSASLVGSEMCIRDRPPPSRPERAGFRTARRGTSAVAPWQAQQPSWPLPCLLYTSDAADDM